MCVQGVLNDVAEGRAAIYVDLLGYDEVAHHSGPERADTLAVLRDLDRQIGRIARSLAWAPRPYHLVVLSDHGQTQGATFRQRTARRWPSSSAGCAAAPTSGDPDAEQGRTESSAWLRQARDSDGAAERDGAAAADRARLGQPRAGHAARRAAPPDPRGDRRPLPGADPRAGRPPRHRLRARRRRPRARSCSAPAGVAQPGDRRGRSATTRWRRSGPAPSSRSPQVDAYRTVADLMINARYDPELDEVAAFEEQVGSHGGLGGPQTHPFLLYPAELSRPGRADLHVGRHAPGAQDVAGRGRPAGAPDRGSTAAGHRMPSRCRSIRAG